MQALSEVARIVIQCWFGY